MKSPRSRERSNASADRRAMSFQIGCPEGDSAE